MIVSCVVCFMWCPVVSSDRCLYSSLFGSLVFRVVVVVVWYSVLLFCFVFFFVCFIFLRSFCLFLFLFFLFFCFLVQREMYACPMLFASVLVPVPIGLHCYLLSCVVLPSVGVHRASS